MINLSEKKKKSKNIYLLMAGETNLNSYDFNWLSAKLGCVWILMNLRGFLIFVSLLEVNDDMVVDEWMLPFELLCDLLSASRSRNISWYIFSKSI